MFFYSRKQVIAMQSEVWFHIMHHYYNGFMKTGSRVVAPSFA